MTHYTTPIYDRTLADVESQTAKAFLNVVDWLRIYNNTEIVNEILNTLLSSTVTFDTVTEPTITTIPTVTQLNTLLANIERIRVAACLPTIEGVSAIASDWVAGSSEDAPTYLDVNEWEKVLDVVFSCLAPAADYTVYCGVGAVGQPRFYQHRFRRLVWVAPSATPIRTPRTNSAICGVGLMRQNGFRRYD